MTWRRDIKVGGSEPRPSVPRGNKAIEGLGKRVRCSVRTTDPSTAIQSRNAQAKAGAARPMQPSSPALRINPQSATCAHQKKRD